MKPFTYDYYVTFLNELKKNYAITDYSTIGSDKKTAVLRHDIDFCLDKALVMANLDYENNVKSNFFFLVSSEFYNIRSVKGISVLREIADMDHEVSIHFDEEIMNELPDKDIASVLNQELKIMESVTDYLGDIVSFHRPSSKVLLDQVEGINHTYKEEFFKRIKYLSDSRKNPREDLIEFVRKAEHDHIQVLIHPFWWGEDETSPQQDYESFIERKIETLIDEIANNSSIFKR